MSAGEALRAAVRQRFTAVLEEVLTLIQRAEDEYEGQLSRSREETERLRRLLQLEPADKPGAEAVPSFEVNYVHPENSPQSNIKEEQPDLWSIQDQAQLQLRESRSASGPHNATPSVALRPEVEKCQERHAQQRQDLPPKHKTESEDSEEECPICRQLDLHQSSPSTGPTEGVGSNPEQGTRPDDTSTSPETNAKNPTEECAHSDEDVKPAIQEHIIEKPQEFENKDVKTEDEDEGYSDGVNKSSEILGGKSTEQVQEEDAQSGKDLKRPASNLDQPVVSKCRKTLCHSESPGEREEEMKESEAVVSSSLENGSGGNDLSQTKDGNEESAHDATMENLTSEPMEQEGPGENEAHVDHNAQNSSPFAMALEVGVSPEDVEREKSRSPDPKEHEDKSLGADKRETQDEVGLLTQKMSKQQPTVKLVPLKLMDKTVTGQKSARLAKSDSKKPAANPKTLSQANKKQHSKDEQTRHGTKQKSLNLCKQSDTAESTSTLEKTVSVAAKSSVFAEKNAPQPSVSSRSLRDRQMNTKEDDSGSEGAPFRRQLSRKAKAKAQRTKQTEVNKESDSGTDTDKYNDSDYKLDNSTDSEGSEDDNPKVKFKKSSTHKSPAVGQSGQGFGTEVKETAEVKSDQASASSEPGSSRKSASKKGDEKHECSECGSTFTLKRNLLMHLVVHQEERPFACSDCDATFKRKLNLKVHMATHSGEKGFQCSICKKKFTRKCNLDDHLKSHTGEKPYCCSVCGRPFSCRSNLRRHMASHAGLRPFDCEVCGKRFGRKSILLEHMTSHTGEQAFSCAVCQTKFSRKHNLLKHMRIHKGERRYKCSECNSRFSQKAHLDQHMFRHTGEKPYKCTVCQKGFTRKAYVQQHLEMYCLGPAGSQAEETEKPQGQQDK